MSEAWPAGRRRLLAGAGALVVVAALSLTLAAPALADSGLGRRIAAILTRYHLAGGRTAVRVWDMDTGEQVYGRRIHALLAPASNEKLVTSATALARWGPDQRFKTELYLPPGQPDAGGVVHGRVWLKGYGDPTLATAAYQRSGFHARTASLAGFVAALRALGVRRVAGGIGGDESYFDRRRTVPGLAARSGGVLRAALGVEPQRGAARRRSRGAARAVCDRRAAPPPERRGHRGGRRYCGRAPADGHAAHAHGVLAAVAPRARPHEQAERQLHR